jgi:hypothetical protein
MRRVAAFRWDLFMRRTLRRLVLTSFAVHMVFGCCQHHVHAAMFGAVAAVAEAACPCGHHESEPGRPEQPAPPCGGCDGDRCVFTRAGATDSPELATDSGGVAPVCVLQNLLDLGRAEAIDSPRSHVCPPVRLHLLKQVLLL